MNKEKKGNFGNKRNSDIHHHERRLEEERARIVKEAFCDEEKSLIIAVKRAFATNSTS